MKKEIVLSIIIGFGIGLVATFGVYWARRSIKEANLIQSPLVSQEKQNGNNSPTAQFLALDSPLDQSISNTSKISLSGTTSPLSWVVILTEEDEKIIQADKKGNFETEITLVGGENEIRVEAISENGEKESKTITVVYSTAEI